MNIQTQRAQLKNGVRVVTEHVPSTRSAGISVLIDASPQLEPFDKLGLAHVCEHALFLGTPQRNGRELARTMDLAGGCFGAFTAPDYTCVFAHVLEDYVTYAMDLVGDMLVESSVEAELLKREKDVIKQEILSYQDDPADLVLQLSKQSLWPNDPLSRSVIGTVENVEAIDRSDVIGFMRQFYTPSRIIVAAAGAVNHDSIVEQVEDAFWNMSDGGEHRQQLTQSAVNVPGRVNVVTRPISQCYFSLAIPTFVYDDDRRYAMHVLSNLLGGGMSSRLFEALREQSGLVYSIDSSVLAYRRAGALLIQGQTSPEQLIQSVHLALSQLLMLSIGERPVEADELWKSKMQVRSQSRLGTDMTSNRVSSIATQEFHFGTRIPDDSVIEAIDSVNIEAIQQVASDVLLNGLRSLSISVVGNVSHKDALFNDLVDLRNCYSSIGGSIQIGENMDGNVTSALSLS
ncbi:MAG: pitrilysin family protein [Pirellulaceae bacterium]|nr:pitrilysin family protein [Pirellulaceae bacterium]